MDYSFKVKVITDVTGNGSEEGIDEFDGVGPVRVSDGHLTLYKTGGGDVAVAVYAPGQWKRFKREAKDAG